jgi:hypothetical protein
VSLIDFPVELAETNRLLTRIADALERLAPPPLTDAGVPRKPRGLEALSQVTNERMVDLEEERERWRRDPWKVTPFEAERKDDRETGERASANDNSEGAERAEPREGGAAVERASRDR